MTKVKRVNPGQYNVDDGRIIIKSGSAWYILSESGKHEFGPVPTLKSAKQYVEFGTTPLGEHNTGSKYGKRQSKKEFNAYLASEAKNGNYAPAIIWFLILFVVVIIVVKVRGY